MDSSPLKGNYNNMENSQVKHLQIGLGRKKIQERLILEEYERLGIWDFWAGTWEISNGLYSWIATPPRVLSQTAQKTENTPCLEEKKSSEPKHHLQRFYLN